jgi:hypothetical protein
LPSIRYFRRRHDEPIATVASPEADLTEISRQACDAEHPQINAGAMRGAVSRGLPGSPAVWAGGAVAAGSVLGMVATVCNGVGAISTQQMIGLALPAVLLIGAGLTAAVNISAAEAPGRGFEFGFQVGANLAWLRSASCRSRKF